MHSCKNSVTGGSVTAGDYCTRFVKIFYTGQKKTIESHSRESTTTSENEAQKIKRSKRDSTGSILEFKGDDYNENISLIKELGSGGYGEIWKGIEKTSGRVVAVKFENKGVNWFKN